MGRPPCCDKLNVKRGHWTAEEDAKILAHVSKHGTGNWTDVPKKAGLRRCGKSCRLRWTNYLRPDLKHEGFTPQEEDLIVKLHAAIGSRWSIIAQQLPGRTDNDVKNYWNTKLRKKLSDMGIDPVTHKPYSQILADYGNLGGFPKPGTRVGSLNRDLIKNAFFSKPDHFSLPPQGFSNMNNTTHLMPQTALPPTKTEPTQECLLNNNNNPMDLLAQLQAIQLVTAASNLANTHENMSPQFFNEGMLSPLSSSSSSCSTEAQEMASLNFSWTDFLLEDAFLQADDDDDDDMQTHKYNMELSSKEVSGRTRHQTETFENKTETQINNEVQSDSSFVEDMIDQDHETFLEFNELLEEPFYI